MDDLQTDKSTLISREMALESENTQLRDEVARLDEMVQRADAHMEAEIAKLHEDVARRNKQETEGEVETRITKVCGKYPKLLPVHSSFFLHFFAISYM